MRQGVSPPTFKAPTCCLGGQQKYKTVMKLSRLHWEVNVTTSKVLSHQNKRKGVARISNIVVLESSILADSRICHD